jgi:hypothetical protein
LAETQAEISRTMKRHIRREWYRGTNKVWMQHFPRNNIHEGELDIDGLFRATTTQMVLQDGAESSATSPATSGRATPTSPAARPIPTSSAANAPASSSASVGANASFATRVAEATALWSCNEEPMSKKARGMRRRGSTATRTWMLRRLMS